MDPAPATHRSHHRLHRVAGPHRGHRRPGDSPRSRQRPHPTGRGQRRHGRHRVVGAGAHGRRVPDHRPGAGAVHRVGARPLLVDRHEDHRSARAHHHRRLPDSAGRPHGDRPLDRATAFADLHRGLGVQALGAYPARPANLRGAARRTARLDPARRARPWRWSAPPGSAPGGCAGPRPEFPRCRPGPGPQ